MDADTGNWCADEASVVEIPWNALTQDADELGWAGCGMDVRDGDHEGVRGEHAREEHWPYYGVDGNNGVDLLPGVHVEDAWILDGGQSDEADTGDGKHNGDEVVEASAADAHHVHIHNDGELVHAGEAVRVDADGAFVHAPQVY